MVLDLLCILLSCIVRHFDNKFAEIVKKMILGRYSNMYDDAPPKKNELYSTFSDREAMKKAISKGNYAIESPK